MKLCMLWTALLREFMGKVCFEVVRVCKLFVSFDREAWGNVDMEAATAAKGNVVKNTEKIENTNYENM